VSETRIQVILLGHKKAAIMLGQPHVDGLRGCRIAFGPECPKEVAVFRRATQLLILFEFFWAKDVLEVIEDDGGILGTSSSGSSSP
jgi:hypothetical protein